MADEQQVELKDATSKDAARGKDEVALELMKFIAITTGYGKGSSGAGYGAKGARSSEEYAESLLELFEKCRGVVEKK
ncbi:MAG TPA: hypothetical protein VE621_06130 [Bryobacteraceae bacterium]|jgi:hypothetical protein|nr:hypothetical protein [Bryobacteraceae bacterium]